MKLLFKISFLALLLFIQTGCKKLIEVDPPNNSTNALNVYTNDVTAAAVLTGLYARISVDNFTGPALTSISLFAGLSSDELTLHSAVTDQTFINYYRNALLDNGAGSELWGKIYPYIYIANAAIEGINASTSLTTAVANQLVGEAKFIRAFCYFYLVNLYGDVPLVLTTNVAENANLARMQINDVYRQIITDLKDAQSLLNSNYVFSDALTTSTERTRPNKWAATSLLARAYLYNQDWANAETEATSVINNTALYDTVSFNATAKVFDKNSKEAIWQLQPVRAGYNSQDGRVFVLPSSGPTTSTTNPVYLSTSVLNSFEIDDLRRSKWVGSVTVGSNTYYYPFKYKISGANLTVTEYQMVLRLAEQYLIRAEARAQQNKISEGKADLNVIRKRAGLGVTLAMDKPTLLNAILEERRVELFTEWGHRWLDLKRTGTVDNVMTTATALKGGTWSTNWALYPIPRTDVQFNGNAPQNLGY